MSGFGVIIIEYISFNKVIIDFFPGIDISTFRWHIYIYIS
jgi:hypothetical protein